MFDSVQLSQDAGVADEIYLSELGPPTRRRMVCIGAVAGVTAFVSEPACAILLHLHDDEGAIRIAFPDFVAASPADAELARVISAIIAINLERTRRFVLIDQAAFPDKSRP